MMTASSPSNSTRSVSLTGYLMASPGPVTDVDGLRKITGSDPLTGGSPFISCTCDA